MNDTYRNENDMELVYDASNNPGIIAGEGIYEANGTLYRVDRSTEAGGNGGEAIPAERDAVANVLGQYGLTTSRARNEATELLNGTLDDVIDA